MHFYIPKLQQQKCQLPLTKDALIFPSAFWPVKLELVVARLNLKEWALEHCATIAWLFGRLVSLLLWFIDWLVSDCLVADWLVCLLAWIIDWLVG